LQIVSNTAESEFVCLWSADSGNIRGEWGLAWHDVFLCSADYFVPDAAVYLRE